MNQLIKRVAQDKHSFIMRTFAGCGEDHRRLRGLRPAAPARTERIDRMLNRLMQARASASEGGAVAHGGLSAPGGLFGITPIATREGRVR
jgi:hypothetical protein